MNFSDTVTDEILDPSTLTKMRESLGLEFFKQLENKTYKVLNDMRIIKAKGMLVDATVLPEKIKYTNDVGLLNNVRVWLAKNIKRIGKSIGKKERTHPREARCHRTGQSYSRQVKRHIIEKLQVAEKIYRQQYRMYTQKTNRVDERIVSFNRPCIRPIKRGKQGKKTEFGGKAALVHVEGFMFMDYFEHRAFAEEELLVDHLAGYMDLFGKLPPSVVMDAKYGTNENREMREELEGVV